MFLEKSLAICSQKNTILLDLNNKQKMELPINQWKKIEEKLRYYDKPFIEISLMQKILDKFAPKYRIDTLCTRWFLSPIIRWKLYLNEFSSKKIWLVGTTILAQYGKGKTYAVGWLYLYNQYHFSQQLPDRITVYNTSIHGKRIIAGKKYIFRKVRPSFFRGIEETNAQWYGKYKRMTRERALIQLIDDSNGRIEYDDDIYYEIQTGNIPKQKIISLSEKYASKRVQILVKNFLEKWRV